MSGDPFEGKAFPRGVLLGSAAIIAFTMAVTFIGRNSGVGVVKVPSAVVVDTLDARFEDGADGSVIVLDASSGQTVATLPAGTNGFIRGVLRALVRDRKLESMASGATFRITRRVDGRLFIADQQTGLEVDLNGFGHTNSEAFAALLDAARQRHAAR